MPYITVLFPFRDAENTIKEAINSILQQTFEDFVVLAINDNSQDESRNIVASIDDPRIQLLDNPGNGLVDALNLGLENVKTRWIARMDADDIAHPQKLEKQWQYHLDNPELDVIATQARLFPEEEFTDGFQLYMDWQNSVISKYDFRNQQYVEMPLTNPTALFRTGMAQQLGLYKSGNVPEDYEYWLRALYHGYQFAKLPEILFDWRESPDRYTRTAPACEREAFDSVRAEYLAKDDRLYGNRPLVVCGAGRVTRKRVQRLVDYGHQISAWIDVDPARIGQSLDGAPIHKMQWLAEEHDPKPFVLIYIARHGARDYISHWLQTHDYKEGVDFLAVG